MSQTEESTLKAFAEFMKARATHMRYSAGMNGSHSDGGASTLEEAVSTFVAGIERKVPPIWKAEWEEFVSEEYQSYLKLQEKYGKHPRGLPLR